MHTPSPTSIIIHNLFWGHNIIAVDRDVAVVLRAFVGISRTKSGEMEKWVSSDIKS